MMGREATFIDTGAVVLAEDATRHKRVTRHRMGTGGGMRGFLKVVSVGLVMPLATSCAEAETPEGGGSMALSVAPLEQSGLAFACYDFLIENGGDGPRGVIGGSNDVIFRGDSEKKKTSGDSTTLCSNRFGTGPKGDIGYVAPCDASSDSDPDKPGVQNTITLWVDGLYIGTADAPAPLEDGPEGQWWKNPCGDDGCQLSFDCIENRDTRVEFDFTIVRQADRGFFDVAVSFESVYCAAKVDCRYSDGRWIRLLRDVEGAPVPTAVFGFTCTDGNPGNDTRLYVTDVEVTCADALGGESKVEIPINKPDMVYTSNQQPGELWLAQAGIFQGEEVLPDGTPDSDQLYWNVAVGFVESPESDPEAPVLVGLYCSMRVWATATIGSIDQNESEAAVTFPYLMADVDISDENGKVICEQYPLDSWSEETDNGLGTFYTILGDYLPREVGPQWWEMSQPGDGGVIVVNPYDTAE